MVSLLAVAAAPAVRAGSPTGSFTWSAHPVAQDADFAEPGVHVDHANRIFVVAPGGNGVQLWRSFDAGKTFRHKEIPSPNGGSDADIDFDLHDVGYTADLAVVNANVSRSTDHFDTWSQQGVGIEQDRQWLAHFCDRVIYLAYHDFVAEAEMLNRSDDQGKTWSTVPTLISPAPGSASSFGLLPDQGVNTNSGPIVVDQATGDVYVTFAISSVAGNLTTGVPPYGETSQIVVAASHDGGRSFDLHVVKAGGSGTVAGLLFPSMTIDRAGTVYVSWAGRDGPTDPIDAYLVHSTDHGRTWSAPLRVNRDVGNVHIYSSVSAGDRGVVDMAWYTSTKPDANDTTNDWFVDFAQIRAADTAHPQVSQARPYRSRIHHGDVCLLGILCTTGDRSLLDFFQVRVGPDGKANIAFANNGSPDAKRRVWFARQTSGPLAGSGLHDTTHCAKGLASLTAGAAR
jgi:hypothetical protein